MAQNSQQEFVQLIQQQERIIYKVCNLYAADVENRKDLFQEIILQAWAAYPRFKHTAKASTWLYRVALNTAISHLRKNSGQKYITLDDLHFDVSAIETSSDQYQVLYGMIGALPPLEKALTLLYLEDKTHAEIAEIMGISVSNVGTKLSRIREKLKKQVQPI